MNTEYRLQIRSHKEVFSDRQSAMKYIDKKFMPTNLVGEPTVYFYGDEEYPNVILAIGAGDERYSTIDIGQVNERVDDINAIQENNTDKINKAIATLKGVIASSGLTFDSNKKENQVTYEPDVKDELIGDTKTIAEAISVISKFVQDNFKSNNLIPVSSKSIDLIYEPVANGMQLKAAVKISTHGDSDETQDNDNIIGLKPDGIYATVNVDYDNDKHELTFVTSGVKNGKFMDDANKKVISLGEHTQYTPDNDGHNVKMVVDKGKNTISADVKLSEDDNNILKVQDEKLIVDGRAANIKYKNKTVYAGLNALENSMEEVNSDIDDLKKHVELVEKTSVIEGSVSDTMVINAEKNPNTLGYKLSGGVRLSPDQSIVLRDGGIAVNISLDVEAAENKLYFTVGNKKYEYMLPGVDIVDSITYDGANKCIVITFHGGTSTTKIPVGDLVKEWEVYNDTNSPVVLSRYEGSPKDKLSASLKLKSGDNNLIKIENGELVVEKSPIYDTIADERNRATAKEAEIETLVNSVAKKADTNTNAINEEVLNRENADNSLAVRIDTLSEKVNSNVENLNALKTSVQANTSDIVAIKPQVAENKSDISDIKKDIVDIDNSLVKDESDIASLKTDVESAKTKIDENRVAIVSEKDRAMSEEQKLASDVSKNANNIVSEQERAIAVETQLSARIDANSSSVNVLNGDDTTPNSVRYIVNHAIEDVTLLVKNEENARLNGDNDLQKQIDAIKESSSSEASDVLAQAKAYTDAEVEKHKVSTSYDINTAKNEAIETAANDAKLKADKALSDAKLYTDAETERAKAAEQSNLDKISELSSNLSDGLTNTLAAAKAYTDTEVLAEKNARVLKETEIENTITSLDVRVKTDIATAVRDAADDATSKANTAELNASNYTDSKVLEETDRAKAAEKANADAIAIINTELSKKIEKVEVVGGGLEYSIKVDGVTAGTIVIPKDQFFKDAVYNSDDKSLTLVFVITENGETIEKSVRIDVSDLVDTYTAGDGMDLLDNKFSIHINSNSESYLKLSADGIGVFGIDNALAKKADVTDMKTLSDKVDVINGNAALEGSFAKGDADTLAAAKAYTDSETDIVNEAITIETDRAKAAEKANADAIAIINGNSAQEGSILNAVKVANDYTDSKISDLSNVVDTKANSSDVYTKAEIDAKGFITEHQDLSGLATKDELSAVDSKVVSVDSRVKDVEVSVNTLNGNEAVVGSVLNAIKTSKDYTDSEITKETERAKTAEKVLTDAVAILNGNSAQVGSVANAITESNKYTDSKVLVETNDRISSVNAINTELANKANIGDSYTKAESDTKYLTSSDIANLAKNSDVQSVADRVTVAEGDINTLEAKNVNIENAIASLQSEDKRLNIVVSETNSIKLVASKQDTGTTLSADVKIKTDVDNILRLDGNGLYSSVNLSYNKAENKIGLVVNGTTINEYTLSDHSLVSDGYYDSASKSIILTVVKDGGTTEHITIPVGDLINVWKVDNGTNNPIKLSKTTDSDNVDVLKAVLDISTESHNAILNNNGTLYVSNQAKDLTALWAGDEITIQKAIENIKTETDKIGYIQSDVNGLKNDMNNVKNDISVLQGNIVTLTSKVEQNTTSIAQNSGAINNLTTQFNELNNQVVNMSNQFSELKTIVESYETRVGDLENSVQTINGDIESIKSEIGGSTPGEPSILERLETIEKTLETILDLGQYNQ